MKDRAKLLCGPILFLLTVFLIPESIMQFSVRGALGTFLWMAAWWIFTPVNIAVTAFLPIVVNAVFGFIPVGKVLPMYAHNLVVLLIGANIITVTWAATGLNNRIALRSLSIIGPNIRQQIIVWFVVSTSMSIFLPNVVVAAALTPIAISMLQYVGKENVSKSAAAANILLAIAWGSGLGGFASPLGGGMNLVAIGYIEELIGQEYMYIDWVIRMFPMLVILSIGVLAYMITIKTEVKSLEGTREYFRNEYAKMDKMSKEEIISGLLFLISIILAFGRPLFSKLLPPFTPPYIFLTLGILAFTLPGNINGKLITWKYASPRMSWGLFYLLAGGLALGTFITQSGAAEVVAQLINEMSLDGGLLTVTIFVILGMILSNVSSNTAACAIAIPIVISITKALGLNPLPYIYITSVAANCAYLLPTSTRAIPISHGVRADYMMKKGFMAVLVSFVIVLVFGMLFINYWPLYSL